ncbi:MAG TPA: deoxyribodipyrimidine photolyase, partial [Pirellulaceae bacterium]|nr:deoxyribodipyrimidine photolyase [Pirellulaceae bacterium]
MILLSSDVPESRIRTIHPGPVASDGRWVIYWMIANRRSRWNFSLQRAADWAVHLGKPLIVLEALRCDYRWASDRIHAFVIQGMRDNAESFSQQPVTYYPYLETQVGEGKGLLRELARQASVVVTDDFPCFFLPRMLSAASQQIPVRFELVDSNGIYPIHSANRVFHRAYDFRRHFQKELWPHLDQFPKAEPLERMALPTIALPREIVERWPQAPLADISRGSSWLRRLPIDHEVSVVSTPGGSRAAEAQLKLFIDSRLPLYAEHRNQPERNVASE